MLLHEKQILIDTFKKYLSEKSFITQVDNNKLFTDSSIKREFMRIINRQDSFSEKYKKKIGVLVDSNFIIPCYIDELLLDKIEMKLFKNGEGYTRDENLLGYYSTDTKRIFMLIKNIHQHDFWGKNDLVSTVLIHEFQHCFMNLFPNSFLAINRKPLDSYYSYFLKMYFGIRESTQSARVLYEYLISSFDSPSKRFKNEATVTQYMDILQSLGTKKSDRDNFKRCLETYINGSQVFEYNVSRRQFPEFQMYTTLKSCYSKLGIMPKMIHSLCIQEIIFAGEVICIESEYNRKDRHLALIDRIKTSR